MPELIEIDIGTGNEAGTETGASHSAPLPSWRQRLARLHRSLQRAGRLMCGIPDYQTYVAHHRAHHPGSSAMSYEAFFRQRLEARYGGGNGNTRCC